MSVSVSLQKWKYFRSNYSILVLFFIVWVWLGSYKTYIHRYIHLSNQFYHVIVGERGRWGFEIDRQVFYTPQGNINVENSACRHTFIKEFYRENIRHSSDQTLEKDIKLGQMGSCIIATKSLFYDLKGRVWWKMMLHQKVA